ncbi:patatin-like phospholipase family protein [Clostridium tagluense]|uniref:patatin-like phospholipase family protein n=1 Tax=Clostridium tagluense TaxID=360422 RepID=UPI001C0CB1A0|nr:patatin-like phospholipase family protein [Clostridium tagluense]MBU3126420.1 patatin-like phospholipase family protein [Clostridium tagluense]MCB2309788.1 patatin-like phospholipase family protein [Clostridium tagluense]MCB2314682.1 patatin-like phospholipase family protein [Clostridium tagluense]MCB2319530.1 patatin-like phospholipase family protein [Clostridium tagluense]MCB2324382.1 patatin-like phospholipase family protein [Clostridium tagluense]
MKNNEKYGVVLGGGGAKGAYEIGVWKALSELGIYVEVVVGTSVGALNGAIMVQGDFDIAYNMWNDLTMSKIINFGQEKNILTHKNLSLVSIINTIKSSLLSGGMDVTPLKELLYTVIDEKKIRESKIDFGIVTFSLTDFKPINIFIKDIPEGRLIEYLLASSCFPTFKPQIIDEKRYVDGGIYDNIPISLICEKSKNIIIVDVSGLGRIKKVDTSNNKIIYIKNSEYLGRTLQFNEESSKNNIELGYFDTLRAFGKTIGKQYYIVDTEICKGSKNKFTNDLEEKEIEKIYAFYGSNINESNSNITSSIKFRLLRKIRKYITGELNGHSVIVSMAEICSECLGIHRIQIYSLEQLIEEIMKEFENYKKATLETNNIFSISKVDSLNKALVFYEPDLNEVSPSIIKKRILIALSQPKYAIANLFFTLLVNRKLEDAKLKKFKIKEEIVK